MSGLRLDLGGSAPHLSRPKLTLDTQPSPTSNFMVDGPDAQSAPVGTHQEKGMVPLYQAGDRHVAKLAEMMDSPTWRNQNPGPHVRNDGPGLGYHQSTFDGYEDIEYEYHQTTKHNAAYKIQVGDQTQHKYQSCHVDSDVIRLSHGADNIKVHGVHSFPKMPATYDNTFDNTYVISASVSQQRLIERARGLRIGQELTEEKCRSDRNGGAYQVSAGSHGAAQYDRRVIQKNYFPSGAVKVGQDTGKQPFPGGALMSGQGTEKKRFPVETLKNDQKKEQKIYNEVQRVTERDEAIQSIQYNQQPSNHRAQATSDEQQRFHNLLNRLHGRDQGENPKEPAPFVDPAIVAFVPKKADPSTPTKTSTRIRSDSGYMTPSVYSRPSTRAQSRLSGDVSGSANSETTEVDHGKRGSHDSGFDESASKKILNPTAKEFALTSTSKASPSKQIGPARSAVFNDITPVMQDVKARPALFNKPSLPLTPQQFQGMLANMAQSQIGAMPPSQGTWYPPQLPQLAQLPQLPQPAHAINNPMMMLANMHQDAMRQQAIQQGPPPGMLPQWGGFAGPSTQSAGPNSVDLSSMGLGTVSGPVPLRFAGFGTPPGLAAAPAPIPSPFHQQLPTLALCNNPTYQALPSFTHPAQSGAVLSAVAPQTQGAVGARTVLTASAIPFIPKHVPKPKVPNTTGQQNWELMHELRRMNEPGYAQKCKEKQKRRHQKMLEHTGGQS